jgi:hypothetical protein
MLQSADWKLGIRCGGAGRKFRDAFQVSEYFVRITVKKRKRSSVESGQADLGEFGQAGVAKHGF